VVICHKRINTRIFTVLVSFWTQHMSLAAVI
jgi:hypothetical protein